MANTASARKRARQAESRRENNTSRKSELRSNLKKVVVAIEKKDKDAAAAAYKKAVPVIDSSVGLGIIHKNKAARHKSRLNAQIRAL